MKHLLFIILIFNSLFSFAQKDKETEIVILYVNDMHGKIDKLPYLSTLIKEIKKQHKYVYFFSAGDIFSGNPVVDKFPEPGFPMIDLMNMLPFTFSTLGNHEFDFGGKTLAKRISELNHAIICANIISKPAYFPSLKPYGLLKADKIKIAVIGVTQVNSNGYPDTHPDRTKEFTFEQGIKSIEKLLPNLKKYDIRIVLSHMGYEQDSILASRNSNITAIVGGHSHKKIQPFKNINGVAIVQAENYLKYLGKMTIKVKNKKVVQIHDTLLPILSNIKPDTAILRKVEFYNENKEFKKVAGYASENIEGLQSLGCFMTTAYKAKTKTDFALQNSGGIRVSFIPQGYITVKQILELDPFANELIVCKMIPEHLRQLIRFGYEKEGEPDIFSAGLYSKIVIDEKGTIKRIELYDSEKNMLDENKFYTVTMGSYIYNAYKFEKLNNEVKLGHTTTDAIFEYLALVKGVSFNNCMSSELIIEK